MKKKSLRTLTLTAFVLGIFGMVSRNVPVIDWTAMDSGTTNDLSAVCGSSARNAFVVGTDGVILYYDSGVWSSMESGAIRISVVSGAVQEQMPLQWAVTTPSSTTVREQLLPSVQ